MSTSPERHGFGHLPSPHRAHPADPTDAELERWWDFGHRDASAYIGRSDLGIAHTAWHATLGHTRRSVSHGEIHPKLADAYLSGYWAAYTAAAKLALLPPAEVLA